MANATGFGPLATNVSPVFGSYALHTDPKSEAILDVCQFEDEMTRDRSPRVQVVWVLEY